jgi:hypothetical protein
MTKTSEPNEQEVRPDEPVDVDALAADIKRLAVLLPRSRGERTA